jgi:hypothetical protein
MYTWLLSFNPTLSCATHSFSGTDDSPNPAFPKTKKPTDPRQKSVNNLSARWLALSGDGDGTLIASSLADQSVICSVTLYRFL